MNLDHIITDTYDVIGEIGKGGGGTVYEAYHKRLRKKVVLKKQHEAIRGLVNERTETDTLKNLRHSNLPQVLDFIVTDDAVYTVMDYIPGQSVKDILKEKGKMPEDEVIKYARQLGDALIYLHNSNPPVIHGDIKPDNIMITPEGNVCLIDFNISSALGAANSYAFGYTLGYAAPEQRRSFEYERNVLKAAGALDKEYEATEILGASDSGNVSDEEYEKTELLRDTEDVVILPKSSTDMTVEEKKVIGILFDKRSDIYSFGATLYHMLTGIKPSSDPTAIKPILDIYPLMNRGLADIITKSMEINPEDRYQSFDEIGKILHNIHKYDLKYRAKVIRRVVTIAISAVILGAVAAVALITLKKKGESSYREKLDTALDMYYGADYEGSIDYIDSELLEGFYFDLDESLRSSAYYLRANNLFNLEQYDEAIEDFDNALTYDDSNALIYRDKAIALARTGDATEALEVLDEAVDMDMDNADLMLANAEIEASCGNTSKAMDLYKECIEASDDVQTRARAYILCASLYDRTDAGEIAESAELLTEASRLDSSLKAGILEQLAQDYIDLAKLNGDQGKLDDALDVFEQIIDNGWDTYTTHNNMAVIYEQKGDLESAEDELMLMKEQYGDNYNTYKRLAFLEIEKQNKNLGADRDYTAFLEYCKKAKELYENQSIYTDDMEMNVLSELKNQIE